jgi:hypothetical protein
MERPGCLDVGGTRDPSAGDADPSVAEITSCTEWLRGVQMTSSVARRSGSSSSTATSSKVAATIGLPPKRRTRAAVSAARRVAGTPTVMPSRRGPVAGVSMELELATM